MEQENLKLKEEQEKALAQIPQQMAVVQANNTTTSQQTNAANAPQTMDEMLSDITSGLLDTDDDELEDNIKSWIEK